NGQLAAARRLLRIPRARVPADVRHRRVVPLSRAGDRVNHLTAGGPHPSADLLCQLDDDPRGPADVAEPVAVLVALELADELCAAGSPTGDDSVDVFDGECEMAEARRVRRRVPVAALGRGRAELDQLESSVAVRGLQDRGVCPDAVEPHDAVHPGALDRPLALPLEPDVR